MRALIPLLFVAACTEDPGDPASEPTVAITAPTEGATVAGPDVEVRIAVEDFTFTPKEGVARRSAPMLPLWLQALPSASAHTPGEAANGYVEFKLDGAIVAEEAAVAHTIAGISAGEHTIEVELLWPDGDAFYPSVEAEVTFTVE